MEKKPVEKMTKESSPRNFKGRVMSKIVQPIKDYNKDKNKAKEVEFTLTTNSKKV
jgi:hypothetical protein